MSGPVMMLLAGRGFKPQNGITISSEAYVISAVSIVFQPSGALTATGSSSITAPSPAAWGSPVGGTPGNGYWVNMQAGSGSGVNAGATRGVWHQINAAVTFQMNSATAGTVRQRTGTYAIATDAAGANVVANGGYTFISDCS